MPVTKPNKKIVSQEKREEIREAVGSIPGLLIEHVPFDQNNSEDDEDNDINHNKKYMLSDEKRREHKKKKSTMFFGVGIVVIVLGVLWIVNLKTFFFDSKHSLSNEGLLLDKIKNDYNNTLGKLGERPEIVSSTVNAINEQTIPEADLKAALLAGLASISTTSSTASSTATSTVDVVSTTSTTSTTEFTTSTESHFPVAEDATTTTTSTP